MYFKAKPLHNHWIYKRGDIYLVDLGPGDGSVQGGTRPAINYQNNTANLFSTIITIVPVTSQIKRLDLPCHVFIGKEGGLRKDSMAMLEQMDTLPKTQVLGYIGKLSKRTMEKIDQAAEDHNGRYIPHEMEAP